MRTRAGMNNRWARRVTMKDALSEIATFPCRDKRNGTTCIDRDQANACESCTARRAAPTPSEGSPTE